MPEFQNANIGRRNEEIGAERLEQEKQNLLALIPKVELRFRSMFLDEKELNPHLLALTKFEAKIKKAEDTDELITILQNLNAYVEDPSHTRDDKNNKTHTASAS